VRVTGMLLLIMEWKLKFAAWATWIYDDSHAGRDFNNFIERE
jgi:hypothetical protein